MYTQRMKVNSNNVHVYDVVCSYERMDLMDFHHKACDYILCAPTFSF